MSTFVITISILLIVYSEINRRKENKRLNNIVKNIKKDVNENFSMLNIMIGGDIGDEGDDNISNKGDDRS